jgi:hypothetical protein
MIQERRSPLLLHYCISTQILIISEPKLQSSVENMQNLLAVIPFLLAFACPGLAAPSAGILAPRQCDASGTQVPS